MITILTCCFKVTDFSRCFLVQSRVGVLTSQGWSYFLAKSPWCSINFFHNINLFEVVAFIVFQVTNLCWCLLWNQFLCSAGYFRHKLLTCFFLQAFFTSCLWEKYCQAASWVDERVYPNFVLLAFQNNWDDIEKICLLVAAVVSFVVVVSLLLMTANELPDFFISAFVWKNEVSVRLFLLLAPCSIVFCCPHPCSLQLEF